MGDLFLRRVYDLFFMTVKKTDDGQSFVKTVVLFGGVPARRRSRYGTTTKGRRRTTSSSSGSSPVSEV